MPHPGTGTVASGTTRRQPFFAVARAADHSKGGEPSHRWNYRCILLTGVAEGHLRCRGKAEEDDARGSERTRHALEVWRHIFLYTGILAFDCPLCLGSAIPRGDVWRILLKHSIFLLFVTFSCYINTINSLPG